MRVAVTGGMGFIGHGLVASLLNEGHEVILVDFWQDAVNSYERARLPIMQDLYGIMPRCAAVVDPFTFVADLAKYVPQVVIHAGAVVDTKDLGSDMLFYKNVEYTTQLAEACEKVGTCIIFISSAAVYGMAGKPNNPYGLTKAMGERIVARSRTRTASVRLFNVFGVNEHHKGEMASVPWKIANSLRNKAKFQLHSVDAKRDFVPVTRVIASLSWLANEMLSPSEKWHKVYDCGTGEPTSFLDLATMIRTAVEGDQDLIEIVERPANLDGRFQMFTCAGINGVQNIGGMFALGTKRGLELAYGVDK